MSVLDAVTVDLPPTATYARREVTLTPGEAPGEGFLTIRLWKGKRAGSKVESDHYQFQEEDPVGVMGRSFLILNLTDPDQKDVYRTVIGPVCCCTCDAGRVKRIESCKHRDSLAALIAEGEV